MIELTPDQARRIAVRAQGLDASLSDDLVGAAEQLTFVQLDPIGVVAPSADLVLRARLGDRYRPADLVDALERDRTMFEFRGQDRLNEPVLVTVRPMSDLGLLLPQMLDLRTTDGPVDQWLTANDGFRQRVLRQLEADGPTAAREIPDTAEVPWKSSGWTHERNVNQMLEFLWSRGYVAVSRRDGKQRIWDLAERVYPAAAFDDPMPVDEAWTERDDRRLRSLGIARRQVVNQSGVEVTVAGTTGTWRADPTALATEDADGAADAFRGRTVLVSPFDRLVHDRKRALELFDFEFTIEFYKPKAKRRWGYYVLPIVHGDRLIGKIDLAADRDASALQVLALHDDIGMTKTVRAAVDRELAALARWLGLDRIA